MNFIAKLRIFPNKAAGYFIHIWRIFHYTLYISIRSFTFSTGESEI